MAEVRESSVMFSLDQLMSLEEQRIREETEARKRREEAARAARAEAERRAREQEEARLRAEEERRRAEEAMRREEAARLEAIRLAEVERARLVAAEQVRLDALTLQQEHERRLAMLAKDDQGRRLRRLVWGIALASVAALGATAGTYFGYVQPSAEARARELAEAIQRKNEENARHAGTLEKQADQVKELERRVAELRAQSQGAPTAAASAPPKPSKPVPRKDDKDKDPPRPAADPGCAVPCQPGDPMCKCLK